jgi:hypothetical protein
MNMIIILRLVFLTIALLLIGQRGHMVSTTQLEWIVGLGGCLSLGQLV